MDPMVGTLARGLAILVACLVLDLAARAQESSAAPPWPWTRRVRALMASDDAGGLDELGSLLDGLNARVRPAQGPARANDDEVFAFFQAAVHLAEHGAGALPGGESPRELFDRARRAVALRDWPDQAAWVELRFAQYVYAAEGRAREAAEILRAELGRRPRSASEFALRQALVEMLRKQARFDEALAEVDRWGARLDELNGQVDSRAALALAGLRGTRGQILRQLGLPRQAAQQYAQEGALAELAGDAGARARHALHRADLDLLTERFDRALATIDEARSSAWFAELPPATRDLFALTQGVTLSEIEREEPEREPRAASVLEAALDAGNLAQHDALVAELNLADLALRNGDPERSGRWSRAARERMEAFRSPALLNERPWLVAHECRAVLARHAEAPGAVSRDELGAARESMRRAWSELLELGSRMPFRPGGLGFLNIANRREALGTLIRCCLATDGPEAGALLGLEHLLEAEALGSIARLVGAPPTTVEAVRRDLLAPDRGALVYLPAKERTHLFVLDRRQLRHAVLPSKDALHAAGRALAGLLATRPQQLRGAQARRQHRSALEDAAQEVGRWLLPPSVRPVVQGWSGLTVAGLELVGAPPLELVSLAPGEPLGWTHAIDHLPSFALGHILAQRAVPSADATPGVALIGNLDPPSGPGAEIAPFERIRFDAAAARDQLRAWPPARTRVAVGRRVGFAELARPEVSGAAVVELWLHGVHDPAVERGAALVLADETGKSARLLTCDAVEAAVDVGGLVVLAACGAAAGPVRYGDDALAHLGGAFLRAGARTVVTSRAPLELETTRALLQRFHVHLAAGASAAEALRRARVDRDGPAGDALAFYLAQLEVTGLGHAPVFR